MRKMKNRRKEKQPEIHHQHNAHPKKCFPCKDFSPSCFVTRVRAEKKLFSQPEILHRSVCGKSFSIFLQLLLSLWSRKVTLSVAFFGLFSFSEIAFWKIIFIKASIICVCEKTQLACPFYQIKRKFSEVCEDFRFEDIFFLLKKLRKRPFYTLDCNVIDDHNKTVFMVPLWNGKKLIWWRRYPEKKGRGNFFFISVVEWKCLEPQTASNH